MADRHERFRICAVMVVAIGTGTRASVSKYLEIDMSMSNYSRSIGAFFRSCGAMSVTPGPPRRIPSKSSFSRPAPISAQTRRTPGFFKKVRTVQGEQVATDRSAHAVPRRCEFLRRNSLRRSGLRGPNSSAAAMGAIAGNLSRVSQRLGTRLFNPVP